MKKKLPNLINIAIVTLVTIVAWIGFSVFREVTKEPEPTVAQEVLIPLDPTLNTTTLSQIESRFYVSDQEAESLIGQTVIIEEEEEDKEDTEESTQPSPSPTASDQESLDEDASTEETEP
jgi:hypothetical protein